MSGSEDDFAGEEEPMVEDSGEFDYDEGSDYAGSDGGMDYADLDGASPVAQVRKVSSGALPRRAPALVAPALLGMPSYNPQLPSRTPTPLDHSPYAPHSRSSPYSRSTGTTT